MTTRAALNNAARSISHQFSVSAEHFAFIAFSQGLQDVTIDLLSGSIVPVAFDVPRNQNLVAICRKTLDRALDRMNIDHMEKATLLLHFGLKRIGPKEIESAIYITTLVRNDGIESTETVQVIPQSLAA